VWRINEEWNVLAHQNSLSILHYTQNDSVNCLQYQYKLYIELIRYCLSKFKTTVYIIPYFTTISPDFNQKLLHSLCGIFLKKLSWFYFSMKISEYLWFKFKWVSFTKNFLYVLNCKIVLGKKKKSIWFYLLNLRNYYFDLNIMLLF